MSKDLSRRQFLAAGVGAAAASALAAVPNALAGAEKENRKPNVLFVFADQLRYSSVGCSGNAQVRTPNIDRLALGGARFTNAVSGYPLCSPYRAMLMTGRYGHSTGMVANDIYLPQTPDSFANTLKRRGYQTGNIGKWHLDKHRRPYVAPDRRQGFDYWVTSNCNHNYFDTPVCIGDSDEVMNLSGYQPDAETSLAIDYIKQHAGRPFFLCMSWGPPHDPYVAPPQWMKMYDPETIEQQPNVECDYRERIAHYYAQITCLDHNIGRLMKALAQAGIEDDTIFVFTSDHGDMLGSHDTTGRARKQRPWDEAVHIPFIVRHPARVPRGSVCDVPLNTVDVMPTVLGLAGAPIPACVQGTDLSDYALGKGGDAPESAFLQEILPCGEGKQSGIAVWRGVRSRRYTYARFRDKGWLLYDNEADPYQLNNLIDKPQARKLQRRMEGMLQDWLKRTGDDFAPAEVWQERVNAARDAGA